MLLQSHRGWSGVREVVLLREEVVVVGGGVIVGGVSQTVAQLIVILTRVWQRRWRHCDFYSVQLSSLMDLHPCCAELAKSLCSWQVK